MTTLLLILFSFLLGSIPFGVLVATSRGVPLRKVGSGNIGATNVLRSVGKGAAFLTLLGDILKGAIATAAGLMLAEQNALIFGLCAILGHDFSPFTGFRGGKGVATSLGVLMTYSPIIAIISVIVWLFIAGVTRYSSLAALVTFLFLPVNFLLFNFTNENFFYSIIMTGLILIKHRENIMRLIKGKETKIGVRV